MPMTTLSLPIPQSNTNSSSKNGTISSPAWNSAVSSEIAFFYVSHNARITIIPSYKHYNLIFLNWQPNYSNI